MKKVKVEVLPIKGYNENDRDRTHGQTGSGKENSTWRILPEVLKI